MPLLQEFFSARTAERSRAWTTGTEVTDDATVEVALEAAGGAQPHRAVSDAFRRFARRGA
jgi:hypothetical protein